MNRAATCLTIAVLFCASTAFAYDMGALPKMAPGIILSAVVPPAGSVPETKQWPAALWFDVNGTPLVLYAKHLSGYNEDTGKGKLMVWVGPPQQYIDEVNADHPYGPADAAKYLNNAGINSVQANIFNGLGNRWEPAFGYQEWNSRTDKCVVGMMMAGKPQLLWRPSIWANTSKGKVWLYRGTTMVCFCPNYPKETPTDNWITVEHGQYTLCEVDQWGLPNNSPVPGETTGQGTSTNTAAQALAPFAGFWYDQRRGLRAIVTTDGVALLTSTQAADSGAVGGSCGVIGDRLTVRACLANETQMWLGGVPATAAQGLLNGPHCLTMVWDLRMQGDSLVGSLRAFNAEVSPAGDVQSCTGWENPANQALAVTWVRPTTSKSLEGPAHKFEAGPGSLQAIYENTR